ncbi:hypothetical protein F0562_017071 [Nyssa sinensis]|uniref:Uncharacterized protein n=1 Tax=Nyssa sinensis TaxID=561372 RepID=A0A5J4ZFN3_9ASTE|nr:hypothetical protein F0562_017071 [Nyssa sinensis]
MASASFAGELPEPKESKRVLELESFCRLDRWGAAATRGQHIQGERGAHNQAGAGAYHYSCNLLNKWSSVRPWSPCCGAWLGSKAALGSLRGWSHQAPHQHHTAVYQMSPKHSFVPLGLLCVESECISMKPGRML